jgi:hypothetical protein
MNGLSEQMVQALATMETFPEWTRAGPDEDWFPVNRPAPTIGKSSMRSLARRGFLLTVERHHGTGAPLRVKRGSRPVLDGEQPVRCAGRCGHCSRTVEQWAWSPRHCADAPVGECKADHYPAAPDGGVTRP